MRLARVVKHVMRGTHGRGVSVDPIGPGRVSCWGVCYAWNAYGGTGGGVAGLHLGVVVCRMLSVVPAVLCPRSPGVTHGKSSP